jgi:hypothetical protein
VQNYRDSGKGCWKGQTGEIRDFLKRGVPDEFFRDTKSLHPGLPTTPGKRNVRASDPSSVDQGAYHHHSVTCS